jgi:peroxiredoxin
MKTITRAHLQQRRGMVHCCGVGGGDAAIAPTPRRKIMSLQDKLDAFRKNFEAGGPPFNAPAWIHEPMHRATAELIASGAAAKALKVGDVAPDFILKDPDGKDVWSKELLAKGPLIVTFYRGIWCPYCNMDLQAIEAKLAELGALGAKLVAISPQTAANSRRSQRENKLSFQILSDPNNAVAAAFGIRFTLPDYLQDLYKNAFKNDLALVNGDASWTLPMPARFVIAQDGRIVYAEVSPDYTRRPDPEELIPVLKRTASLAA